MSKKFYISDLHFGHENILYFDDRPFTSAEDMEYHLIENWNSVVQPGDVVYVLGDMFWCNMEKSIEILDKLNGNKFLIKGNHDRCHDKKFLNKFVKADDYMEIEDEGRNVVLCHYPIPYFKNHYYGWYHLYGHVHNSFEASMAQHDKYLMEELYSIPCNMYNVGCMVDYMNYTPKTLDEIIEANKK